MDELGQWGAWLGHLWCNWSPMTMMENTKESWNAVGGLGLILKIFYSSNAQDLVKMKFTSLLWDYGFYTFWRSSGLFLLCASGCMIFKVVEWFDAIRTMWQKSNGSFNVAQATTRSTDGAHRWPPTVITCVTFGVQILIIKRWKLVIHSDWSLQRACHHAK